MDGEKAMITVELTHGFNGDAILTKEIATVDALEGFVKEATSGRYRRNPADAWIWTGPFDNGEYVIDFGSHSYFVRIKGYNPYAPNATNASET